MKVLKGAPPLVKKQLVVFTIASVAGCLFLAMTFLRLPETLGFNRHVVTVEFAQGAGLYEGAEVTYRGHPVGKVASMSLRSDRLLAELRLVDDVAVPSDVTAEIHSRSAVGEQYVDLVPSEKAGAAPLADGDSIPMERTSAPVEIGRVLDNVHALVDGLDERRLNVLLSETDRALRGRAGDLQTILDRGGSLIDTADTNFRPTEQLLHDVEPVLDTMNGRAHNIRRLSRNLAHVTDELRAGDRDLRRLVDRGPLFSRATVDLLDDLDSTLPGMLRPVTAVARTLQTYNAHLEQLLSDYPLALSIVQSITVPELGTHDIRLTLANMWKPAECTKGFVPPTEWASPFDTSPRRTPLVYCQEPESDPRSVRGARNVPCALAPGRRAGDASQC